jgi:3-deoxy-7-phosphoheptulonate synthase
VELVEPMSLAAAAAGADGLMIEVHDNPSEALSDKSQALLPDQFRSLVDKVRLVRACLDGWR